MNRRPPPGAFAAFRAFLRWDVTAEMRRKGTLAAMGTTALVTLFVFSFAIDPTRTEAAQSRAGVLWVTWLLAGSVGIDRAFRGDGRLLEALLLAPAARPALFYARVASVFLFVSAIALASLPLFFALFDVSLPFGAVLWLTGTALLALLGMAASGVLLSAMTWSLRAGDVLLRVLLLPMLLPAFAAAVNATSALLEGGSPSAEAFAMLGAFDLLFLGAGHLLFDHVTDDLGAQG